MPRQGTIAWYANEMANINRLFLKIKNRESKLAKLLIARKDRLIDEMAASCPHPAGIGTHGSERRDPRGLPFMARRICTRCGYCEIWREGAPSEAFDGKPVQVLEVDEYAARQGELLKKLGINI